MTLLSRRSALLSQSEIRNMTLECEKVEGVNLAQGICDLELPLSVKKAAQKAMDQGLNYYTRYDGFEELRIAISKKLRGFNKIKADPEKNIIVSGGSTGAFYCACLALLNPGDEMILFEPYYGYHLNTLLAVDVVPVYVSLTPPDWKFNLEDLERVVSPKTKGIVINTPANPSGKVFTKKELELLADFCVRHDILIFTDEIYEYFVYDGLKHLSPGALPKIQDRVLTISGYSKAFSITGWRVGYCVCHEKWATRIGHINDLVYVCSPAPLQIGVARGIEELKDEYYKSICREYVLKRDQLCDVLTKVKLRPFVPQGAYYVLADIGSLPGKTSKEKAMFLLQKTGVASVPGSAFYHDDSGEHLARFCFGKKDEELDHACERLLKL